MKTKSVMSRLGALLILAVLCIGCGGKKTEEPDGYEGRDSKPGQDGGQATAHIHDTPGETCYLCDTSLREKGRMWCREHTRYENRCWICQPQLREKGRPYCEEHYLYENECFLCNPGLKATSSSAEAKGSQLPRLPRTEACKSHGIDKKQCFLCDSTLRGKGRLWCKEHNCYEDRCWDCHPGLQDKARPYCKEHRLYEDECIYCNRALRTEFKDQRGRSASARPALYCKEHRVPEHECGICQPQLAATLKPGQSMKVRFASNVSILKAGIQTAAPKVTSSPPTLEVFCRLEYNANALAHISPWATGIVRRVMVDVGSQVKAGDVMAELDSPVLAKVKSDYLAKMQAMELSMIDLDRSKVLHANTQKALAICEKELKSGNLEELGGLDLGLNRRDLLVAHAQLGVTGTAYAREKTLWEKKIGSQADLQKAEAAYRKASAEYLAVRDDLAFRSKRDLEAKVRARKSSQFDLESARRQLLTLGLVESQIGKIPTQVGAQLARQHVRAPFSGTVIKRTAAIGETIDRGRALFALADLSTLWLELSIPTEQAALIERALDVRASFDGLPGVFVDGRVVWVATAVDDRSRMIKARAVVPNTGGVLKSGMFGKAIVTFKGRGGNLSVPKGAIQRLEGNPYLFVREEQDLYALRRIVLGNKTDAGIDVIAGIRAGEQIVVGGTFTVMSEFLKSRLGAGCVDE